MRVDLENEFVQYARSSLPRLHRVALVLCGDAHRAEDVVQETLTALYLQWPATHSVTNLDAYVRTILVRTFLRERRRPWAARVQLGDPPEVAERQPSDVEDRATLVRALAQVPPRQRAVLVLRFLCDMSVEDVASTLDCSPGTVKSQTAHGLSTMRNLLDGEPRNPRIGSKG